jgi:tight adherence protein C
MAAKTTIKLIFPLVLFIFPCLFLVTLGPAVILMSESFKDFLTH